MLILASVLNLLNNEEFPLILLVSTTVAFVVSLNHCSAVLPETYFLTLPSINSVKVSYPVIHANLFLYVSIFLDKSKAK